jgi:ABC-type Na+ efflux pump permease subunit
MLFGPIFQRELNAVTRRRHVFIVRTIVTLILGAPALLGGFLTLGWAGLTNDVYTQPQLWRFGCSVFIALLVVEMVVVLPLSLSDVSPAVAEEREKDTLSLLLLTRLTRVEIILAKLFGRLIPSLSLALAGLPLALGAAWCAGLSPLILAEAAAVVASTIVVIGAFSVLASARRERVGTARAQAMAWSFIWFLMIPICSILPFRSGTLWGDLAVELRRLCGWIAPSSPVSLVTQSAWITGVNLGDLSRQLIIMLGYQMVLIVLDVFGAASGLKLRERHAFSWDPYGGFRPPVGDDPVFWREYTLPRRGASRPMVYYQARHIVILLRMLFVTIVGLIAMAVAVAIPIAMVVATAYYGYLAFLELARDGYFPAGGAPARDSFNRVVRLITAGLAMAPFASLPGAITARFTIERDKKTWDALLVTPLTGAEIIAAKIRASTRGLWTSIPWLLPLWALGILAGSVHPLTALLGALALLPALWFATALGAWLGVRPRSASTTKANSDASLASLGVMVVVGMIVVGLLCTRGELAFFMTWDIRIRVLVLTIVVALPALMAAIAWRLARRTNSHFDEWVGRPHRASQASSNCGSGNGRLSGTSRTGSRGNGALSPSLMA